jgi:acetyltransferase-like isoleucine patch superfamily enzyme
MRGEMLDYNTTEVKVRSKDKASPGSTSLCDRLRTHFIAWLHGIDCGTNIVFKQNITISKVKDSPFSIGDNSLIHRDCWFLLTMPSPKLSIGRNVNIGAYSIIAAKNHIEIGDFSVLAPYCYVIDHEHGFAPDDLILNQNSIIKDVVIGRDCYLGAGTMVLAGSTIGDGAIIGARSVVKGDIPSGEVWAGNPARFIRKR